jgi:hypothetical protein
MAAFMQVDDRLAQAIRTMPRWVAVMPAQKLRIAASGGEGIERPEYHTSAVPPWKA